MESLDYWRLCDELFIWQAALLIVGLDPSSEDAARCDGETHEQPTGYAAARTALMNAIRSGRLRASIRQAHSYGGRYQALDAGGGDSHGRVSTPKGDDRQANNTAIFKASPDWSQTTVMVPDLVEWLRGQGFCTGFFFPLARDTPDYLDRLNPRYAPKLAAAVHAWQAVTEPRGTSAKKLLEKWLREHAAEFGLTDIDGKPTNQAISDCSAVANWQPNGGAPKTPGG